MKKILQVRKYKDSRCVIEPSKGNNRKYMSKKCKHKSKFVPKRRKGPQTYNALKRQASKAEKRFANV